MWRYLRIWFPELNIHTVGLKCHKKNQQKHEALSIKLFPELFISEPCDYSTIHHEYFCWQHLYTICLLWYGVTNILIHLVCVCTHYPIFGDEETIDDGLGHARHSQPHPSSWNRRQMEPTLLKKDRTVAKEFFFWKIKRV